MATSADEITVEEFGQLLEEIGDRLRSGESEFRTVELADELGLTDGKVNEALLYLSRKYDHIEDIERGRWRIEDENESFGPDENIDCSDIGELLAEMTVGEFDAETGLGGKP